jgi:hypothetical protein
METYPIPRVVFAERLDGGVVVTFEDGKCALYSAALLYLQLDQAQILLDEPDDLG